MRIIALVTLAILVVDLVVFRKTIQEYGQMADYLENDVFHTCYRPQSFLRLVF